MDKVHKTITTQFNTSVLSYRMNEFSPSSGTLNLSQVHNPIGSLQVFSLLPLSLLPLAYTPSIHT
jgi:hypothetical protein